MKYFLENIIRFTNKINIPPFGKRNLFKFSIFLFWSLNAIFFLADEIAYDYDNIDNDIICKSSICVLAKKITKTDLFIAKDEIVCFQTFEIFSSYFNLITENEIIFIPRDRSPPV